MVSQTEDEVFRMLFKAYQAEMDTQSKTIMDLTHKLKASGDELSPEAFAGLYSSAVGLATLKAVSKLFSNQKGTP